MKTAKKAQFITQDYPLIVDLFGSENPGQVAMYLLPVFIFLVKKIEVTLSLSNLGLVLLGILYWSFLEYAIHRFIYHGDEAYKKMRYTVGSFHLYHHQNMKDLTVLNAGALIIYPLCSLLLLPIHLIFGDWQITGMIGLGLMGFYFTYECIHYLIHYKKFESGYMKFIQNYHFHHHDLAPLQNFGNTTALWDKLFGTYDVKYKNYKMPQSTYESLITTQKSSVYEKLEKEQMI